MAITQVTCGPVNARTSSGATMPVEPSQPAKKEKLVPGASNQVSTITANAGDFWHVTTDTAIWVKFGATPVATDGDTHFLPAGSTRSFAATGSNEKIAVLAA
ncbi:hypothetical protein ACFOKF_16640 [Sphingobium rhizovicinum]|uniref:Uncharacterized protein n=1 Tax=Sphingobium rhizovicinum TaxID=432308 RepID=A0ABV7NH55_9SPHN